jgi:hypothetical protein
MLIIFLLFVTAYADTPCPTAAPYSTGDATLDISQSQCKEYATVEGYTFVDVNGHTYDSTSAPTGCVYAQGIVLWVDPGFRTEHSDDNIYSLTDEKGNVNATQHTPGFPSYASLGQPCSSEFNCVKCLECTGNQMVAYTYKHVKGPTDTFSYAISRHMCIALYDRSDRSSSSASEDQYINTIYDDWDMTFGCSKNVYYNPDVFYEWTKHTDITTCGGMSYLSCRTVETATCVEPCGVNHYYDPTNEGNAKRCTECYGSPNPVPTGVDRVHHAYLPYKNHTYQHCVPAHWTTCGELPNLPETYDENGVHTHGDGQIGQRYVAMAEQSPKANRHCEVCPVGYAAPFGTGNTNTECDLCSGGYGGSNGTCVKCPVDKYQAHKSPLSTPCADKACPKGQGVVYTLGSLESTCQVCPAGTFSNSDTTGQCVACDGANFYTADANGDVTLTGAEQCLACPAGKYNTDSSNICCTPLERPASDNLSCEMKTTLDLTDCARVKSTFRDKCSCS